MKITIFMGSLSGGGAERVTCNLANHLAAFGHQVELLTMAEDTPAEPLAKGIVHTPLVKKAERSNFLFDNAKRLGRLRGYMKREAVDAYIVMLPVTTILMLTLAGATKAPIIVSERADPKKYSGTIQKLLKRLAPRAAGFVFQTEEAKAWYEPHLKTAKAKVIPNAINPAFLRPAYTGQREKTVAAAGRLTEQKNFALLIRAFAAVAPEFPEHSLTIYGKGPKLSQLQALAAELGIAGRVEFPGHVADMPERLEKAGMFVLSSDYEGMPNALMEAMALGLPCVSTDCGGGGARFLIDDGVNGLLVPIQDENAMAQAMAKILSTPEMAAMLGENGRVLQQTLAPEKIYRAWESFIGEIGEGK